jgi:glucokinase
MAEEMVLALDVGGTKLAAGLVDGDGRLVGRQQVATPPGTDPEALFAVVTGLLDDVRSTASAELVGFGVGCGGPMTATGVSPLNIPAWRGFPLRDRLAEHTGLAVVVDNDAKALALGEGWIGAARGVRDYVAMVVSTGVGGGIVLDGRMLDGHDGNAGHIGHLIVEPGGRVCACGARGCLEAEASGTAIRAITGAHPKDAPQEVRERTGTLVGRAVASVANLLDLRLACVAGSVALGYGDVFLAAARAELAASARMDHSRGTEIRIGGCGDEGPLVGAGALGWRAAGRPVT